MSWGELLILLAKHMQVKNNITSMKVVAKYISFVNIIKRACKLIANTTKKKDEPDSDDPNDLDYF